MGASQRKKIESDGNEREGKSEGGKRMEVVKGGEKKMGKRKKSESEGDDKQRV